MNEQIQQQLQALLGHAGLGDMSKYFTENVGSLISQFGFKDPGQIKQFKQLFQGFKPETYLQAWGETENRFGERTGMLGERLSSGLGNVASQLETGIEGLRQKGYEAGKTVESLLAKGGFDAFGGADKLKRKMDIGRSQSLEDMLEKAAFGKGTLQRQYTSGISAAEQERGVGRGAIYASLQQYLDKLFGRAGTIYGLDPTGGYQYTPGDPGGGGGTGSGTGSSIGTGMGTYV